MHALSTLGRVLKRATGEIVLFVAVGLAAAIGYAVVRFGDTGRREATQAAALAAGSLDGNEGWTSDKIKPYLDATGPVKTVIHDPAIGETRLSPSKVGQRY